MEQSSLEEISRALREEYGRNLPAKVAALEAVWAGILEQKDNTELGTLIRLAHMLAGSGATYGYAATSRAAHELELYAKALDPTQPLNEERIAEMHDLLDRLNASVSAPPERLAVQAPAAPAPQPPVEAPALAAKLLWLCEPGAPLANDIESQAEPFGYQICAVDQLPTLPFPPDAILPDAIVLDWDAAQTRFSKAELSHLTELHKTMPALPIVFVSEREDLEGRLAAVRHGATAVLPKPLDLPALVETLDVQLTRQSSEPYRILIVEDDPAVAALSAASLGAAGMLTRVVTDPLKVMSDLADFNPDLILTDMHMPQLSGMELAQLLQQQPAFVSIPIVFLSGETDLDKQLQAMRLGGDDFLPKPIQPYHLISIVTSRVQRARVLRSLAERDSLTGLLNHTRLKEQLVVEVARAQRLHTDLAYAMLDLDHFKKINDTYGHVSGDRVLRILARLLRQRVRKTDILGRYGGEEFAIVLPSTDAGGAYMVIEALRESFERLRHQAAGIEFSVTFSAGIGLMPPCADADALNRAADQALYQAKRNGRNQTVVAMEE